MRDRRCAFRARARRRRANPRGRGWRKCPSPFGVFPSLFGRNSVPDAACIRHLSGVPRRPMSCAALAGLGGRNGKAPRIVRGDRRRRLPARLTLMSAAAQPVTRADEIAIDADDIAGVVTSENGPEAGVWVVAETEDLPTKFRKIVVTDDAGSVSAAGSAARNLSALGTRLRPRRLAAHACLRREPRCATGRRRPERARGGRDLPGQLLVLADSDPGRRSVPGDRRERQRHRARHGDATPLDQSDQDRLQRLPSARQSRDANVSRNARTVRVVLRRLGSPHSSRPRRHIDDRSHRPARPQDCAHDVRGLDGPYRGRRGPARAAAPRGHRAQSRAHALGMGRPCDVRS